jgi:hypothetical protein
VLAEHLLNVKFLVAYTPEFAFYPIEKCASNSMWQALYYAGWRWVKLLPRFFETGGAPDMRGHLREISQGRTTVAIIRNPLDRMLSTWFTTARHERNLYSKGSMTLAEFVRLVVGTPQKNWRRSIHQPQTKWLEGVRVDRWCRFDSLEEDFADAVYPLEIHHLNASRHGHWRDYYDDDSEDLVRRWAREDFEVLESMKEETYV